MIWIESAEHDVTRILTFTDLRASSVGTLLDSQSKCCKFKSHVEKPRRTIIEVFPKIDHSGHAARIALEQNKFTK